MQSGRFEMAEEREKKNQPETKSQRDENASPGNDKPRSVFLFFNKLKKYLLPASIALGASLTSILLYGLFFQPGEKPIAETPQQLIAADAKSGAAETGQEKTAQRHKGKQSAAAGVDKKAKAKKVSSSSKGGTEDFGIDTTAIMKELEMIFVSPDKAESELGLTTGDSADTVDWLQRETAKLLQKEAEIDKKTKKLLALEDRVNEGLLKIEQAESKKIISLARLYDGMRPSQVAKLFANLSDDIVISILPRMKPSNAAWHCCRPNARPKYLQR
jgi:flagellar motility protein MotE (MotC chaperone)